MPDHADAKKMLSISIDLMNTAGKTERLLVEGTGPEELHISRLSPGQAPTVPLRLSEDDLVLMLEKALRAGLLSKDFLVKLHSEFEI